MKPSQRRHGAQFEYALGTSASSPPPGLTISRMDSLRRNGQPEEAVRVLRKAVTEHPALAVGLLARLRAATRQPDVEMLLDLIASAEPALFGHAAAALWCSGDAEDLAALINRLVSRTVPELADAAVVCDATASAATGSPTGENPLIALLLAHPLSDVAAAIEELRRQGRAQVADGFIAVLSRGPAHAVCATVAELARCGLSRDARTLLNQRVLAASPADLAELFIELARDWEAAAAVVAPLAAGRADAAAFLAALRAPRPGEQADDLHLGQFLRLLSSRQLAALCTALTEQSAWVELDATLTWCAREDASGPDWGRAFPGHAGESQPRAR